MRVNVSKSAAEGLTKILRNLVNGDNVDKDSIMYFLKMTMDVRLNSSFMIIASLWKNIQN